MTIQGVSPYAPQTPAFLNVNLDLPSQRKTNFKVLDCFNHLFIVKRNVDRAIIGN